MFEGVGSFVVDSRLGSISSKSCSEMVSVGESAVGETLSLLSYSNIAFMKAKATEMGSVDDKPIKTWISNDGIGIMFLMVMSIFGLHSFSKSETHSDPSVSS